jgi:hypothetical protein
MILYVRLDRQEPAIFGLAVVRNKNMKKHVVYQSKALNKTLLFTLA